ncbi:bacteriocin-like protein [Chryseobacterium sp. 2987]|uniref:bacteriocin-like protein n=1 Tax=Chryseobacterium sp. 2987 TaxID=2817767 RepID=UPI0028603578|nr:hypothetical protein [Chryseobacterium sp. 2987]MDR6921927.1 hypothetical protein [Chryseobacterium sp. 2987]
MKNLKSLSKEAQKSIHGGGRIVCCDYNNQGKCILWIGRDSIVLNLRNHSM